MRDIGVVEGEFVSLPAAAFCTYISLAMTPRPVQQSYALAQRMPIRVTQHIAYKHARARARTPEPGSATRSTRSAVTVFCFVCVSAATAAAAVVRVRTHEQKKKKNSQQFVEGYVRERRRYLSRRVSAQREGHGGFHREEAPVGPGGRASTKVTEAEKAEFSVSSSRACTFFMRVPKKKRCTDARLYIRRRCLKRTMPFLSGDRLLRFCLGGRGTNHKVEGSRLGEPMGRVSRFGFWVRSV